MAFSNSVIIMECKQHRSCFVMRSHLSRILVYFCLLFAPVRSFENEVYIDLMCPSVGPLRHFWDSTGFSPSTPEDAEYMLLSQSEKLNLILIAALPRSAVKHIRVHWMLNLVKYRNSQYDFSLLDQFIGWLQKLGLSPGFELMGNPGQLYNNFGNETQIEMWQDFINKLVGRYIDQYGLETVSEWRFETWNEPDLKMYNTMNFTLSGYLNYFSASAAGISFASGGRLSLGAPAGLFKSVSHHPLCWGLLNHCEVRGCNLSFLSFHKKGNKTADLVVKESIDLITDLQHQFPKLSTIPFANDEADPLTGWWKNEEWRSDVRYAAIVTRVISNFQKEVVNKLKLPFAFISNDNGFLSSQPYSFTQRTLLARFQMNITKCSHNQFFQKPVYAAMALLSMFGDSEVRTGLKRKDEKISLLASVNAEPQWSATVMITYSDDIKTEQLISRNITLSIRNIPYFRDTNFMYAIYVLNNFDTSPYHIWKKAHFPSFPTFELRKLMRDAEGPRRVELKAVTEKNPLKIVLPLSLPTIASVFLCSSDHNFHSVGEILKLRAYNITFNEVLLSWTDMKVNTKCVKTYEVEFLQMSGNLNVKNKFRRINTKDTILLSFHYAPHLPSNNTYGCEAVRGLYRVRVVDFWQRAGPYSKAIGYPKNLW